MTKRQITRRAMSAEHKRLMLAYARARGGERMTAWRKLRDYVAAQLRRESGR